MRIFLKSLTIFWRQVLSPLKIVIKFLKKKSNRQQLSEDVSGMNFVSFQGVYSYSIRKRITHTCIASPQLILTAGKTHQIMTFVSSSGSTASVLQHKHFHSSAGSNLSIGFNRSVQKVCKFLPRYYVKTFSFFSEKNIYLLFFFPLGKTHLTIDSCRY